MSDLFQEEETMGEGQAGVLSHATIDGALHGRAEVNGTELHYVRLGDSGSPVVMVHGFPESWWAFHKVMPLLAEQHRVIAVDLRGFGDSSTEEGPFDRATTAEDLAQLIDHLDLGPAHVTGQDLGGPTAYTLAATAPDRVRSLTLIEAGLHGFGLERFMDVTSGGHWHFGFFASPYAEVLMQGKEHAFLARYAYEDFVDDQEAITAGDIGEFLRTYARPGGYRGMNGLYCSHVHDGDELRALGRRPLEMEVLAIGASGRSGFGELSRQTAEQIATDVRSATIACGHFVAQERPQELAEHLRSFWADVDRTRGADA
jgi:pimeloyl-ACP methyl ester carboxylesterase